MSTTHSVKKFSKLRIVVAATLVLGVVVAPFNIGTANASAPRVIVRFDRMKAAQTTTGEVCLDPGTGNTSADVKTYNVVFPAGYTISTTGADWQTTNISTSNIESGASAWPNATAATASVTSQTVTWTNASPQTMTAGTLYCFRWTLASAVTTASAANNLSGSVTTKDSSAVVIYTTGFTTATITDDQLTVTATVPQQFQFSLSNTSDSHGTLTYNNPNVSSPARTVGIITNAQNGWYVWAKDNDANTGLYSTTAAHSITTASPGTASQLSNGSEGYITGLSSTNNAGTGSISLGSYDFAGGGGNTGSALDTSYRVIASSNGPNDASLAIKNQIQFAVTTAAATDYSDHIVFVGAGSF